MDSSPSSLFDAPEIYDAVKAPKPDDVTLVRRILATHVGPGPYSVLDPACGPGNWLAPFAQAGARLVGNDAHPAMVRYAQGRFSNGMARVVQGDLWALGFDEERFDVVLEASGVTSQIGDIADLGKFFSRASSWLSPRGAVVVTLNFDDPHEVGAALPRPLWSSGESPVNGHGGRASIYYELTAQDPIRAVQTVRRTVRTQDCVGFPPMLEESYPIRIWKPREFVSALGRAPDLWHVGTYDPESGRALAAHVDPVALQGERIVVLRRRWTA